MGGNSPSQSTNLPTIIFNDKNLIPGSGPWKSTSDSVRLALESFGCFVAAHETLISRESHEIMFDLLERDLFPLPIETKKKHTSKIAGFGYGGNYNVMPLLEYFGIDDGVSLHAAQDFASLMWSHGHQKFSETMYSYCKTLSELDLMVKKMVLGSYGLEKYSDPFIGSSFYMTRLMRYKSLSPEDEKESSVGIVPHRDKSFMSVIGTNDVQGLQIETRNGEWIDFVPSPSTFIVIVGEPLMAWSNGRIYAPLHRVMSTKRNKDKYSICLFSFVRGVLQVPEELVDDENPLKFKSFSNLDFLDYCKDGGPKMSGAIDEYCGNV